MEGSFKRPGAPLQGQSPSKKVKINPAAKAYDSHSPDKFDSNNWHVKAKKQLLQKEYILNIKDDIFSLHTGINKKEFYRINSLFEEKIKSQCSNELILLYFLINVEKRDICEYFAINKAIFDRKYREFTDALNDKLPSDESTKLRLKGYFVKDRPLWDFPENENFENAVLAIKKEIIPRKAPNEYKVKNSKSEIAQRKQKTYFDEINDEEFKRYTGINKELFNNIAAMFPKTKGNVTYEACLFCSLINVARKEILEALDINSSSFGRRKTKFNIELRKLVEVPEIIKLRNIMASVDKRPRWQPHKNLNRPSCLTQKVEINLSEQETPMVVNLELYSPLKQHYNCENNAIPTQNMNQMETMTTVKAEIDIESWLNYI
jgi:hypothetical protein